MIDYRKLRFNNINSDEFKHLKLFLWWPLFGMGFAFVERFYPVSDYHVMYSPLDDKIPFCEFFVFPYLFWFVFLAGIIIYTLLFDVQCFKKTMYFFMITYTVTLIVYFIYPTCQELRPTEFERDNFLTQFMSGFYQFDTNTNVCPSIHVLGALAVYAGSLNTERFKTTGWRIFFAVSAFLICASTVFLKQHSILDVLWAIPLCIIAYIISFKSKKPQKEEGLEAA